MKGRILLSAISCLLFVFLTTGLSSAVAAEKVIELKLSHWMSPLHNLHVGVFTPFAKELEERTKGRVKITIYGGEALGKAKDQYDSAVNGISDIALFIQGYTSGRFPLTQVIELPIGVPSAKVGSRVIWELYEKHLRHEYPGVKLLTLWTHEPGHVHMSRKSVKTLEDIKGLRLRSPGPIQTVLVRELGASPITMPVPELYDALQRGMADGTVIGFSAVKDFKLYEVLRHHTLANLYVMTMGLAMNLKAWDSLPPDIQQIMEGLIGARLSEMAGNSFDKYDALGKEEAKRVGAEIYALPPAEKKRWDDRVRPLNEKWVADMEAKKLPGKKIFEEATQLVARYSK